MLQVPAPLSADHRTKSHRDGLARCALVFAVLAACSEPVGPAAPADVAADVTGSDDALVPADDSTDASSVDVSSDDVSDALGESDSLSDGDSSDDPDTLPSDGVDIAADIGDSGDSGDPADTADLSETDGQDADPALPPCSPLLRITPTEATLLPLEALDLQAEGGTGAHSFDYIGPPGGSLLNPLSGRFIASRTGGETVTIVVTDHGCTGSAEAHIRIVKPLEVAPRNIEIPPGGTFTIDLSEGSGQFDTAILPGGLGGNLVQPLQYEAPAEMPGDNDKFVDIIEITDRLTDERVTILVTLTPDAAPRLSAPASFIPLGSTASFSVAGGSGHYDITTEGPLPLGASAWSTPMPGLSTVTVTDRFTGLQTRGLATTLAPLGKDVRPSLPPSTTGALVSADVDGDGAAELVTAVAEVTVDRAQSGAVYIYRGRPEGPSPTPAQRLSGATRSENYGRALALDDLSGDGLPDLVIGSSSADGPGLTDRGRVDIHLGQPDGLFATPPARSISGERASDTFGTSVAICDFNGDGALDLAVGAPLAEDPALGATASGQGRVDIHLGSAEGLASWSPEPAQIVYGMVPAGSSVALGNLRYGSGLAAGDIDGDGLCDLVVHAAGADLDGLVYVHRGLAPDPSREYAIDPIPARAWNGLHQGVVGSRLGLALAVGDLDGDGAADIAMGQRSWSTVSPPASNNARGATRLVRGGAWATGTWTGFSTLDAVDWSAFGGATSDNFGQALAIGDVTGDHRPDLLIGVLADELAAPAPSGTGSVRVHEGLDGALPLATQVARYDGQLVNDRCGAAVVAIARKDAAADIAALCIATDASGPDVGGPIVHRGGAPSALLAMPVEPAPWRVGHAVATIGDLDGDGYSELAVGSPDETSLTSTASHASFAGLVHLYKGTATGFESTPFDAVQNFTGHSASDRFGTFVSHGDVDGDGRSELVAVARLEDRASSYAATTYAAAAGDCAQGSASDLGAVYVFPRTGLDIAAEPSHVLVGNQASQAIERAIAIDIDGDGRDDVIAASTLWDAPSRTNAGGIQVFAGRPAVAGRIAIDCTPDREWLGRNGDNAGAALVELGDLDADGCDDFAFGAPLDDTAGADAGAVHVILGGGARCDAPSFRAATLTGVAASDGLGESLDAADVDGDGLPELVVGSTRHRRDGVAVGAVWLVPGRFLRAFALSGTPLVDGVIPEVRAPIVDTPTSPLTLEGRLTNERFGAVVALVPRLGPAGHPALITASPAGDRAGPVGVSTFVMHEIRFGNFESLSISPRPAAVLAGETATPAAFATGALAAVDQRGVGVVALGVSDSNALARDFGAVYTARVDVLEPILPEAPSRDPVACDPALGLTPLEVTVGPRLEASFRASGGYGEFVFELVRADSGGSIDPGSGDYVAGPNAGVDTVRLTSRGCVGAVEATVRVLADLVVAPKALAVPPLRGFTPEVSGGSGHITLSVAPNASGANISGGRYTAGPNEGLDTLVLTDDVTGDVATVSVTVSRTAGPELGVAVVYVPESSSFKSAPTGGSGEYGIVENGTVENGIFREDGAWRVEGDGRASMTVTDRWSGVSDSQRVEHLSVLGYPATNSATLTFIPAAAIGHLDGDAYPDAVVALSDGTFDRSASGGLWVYRGTATGLEVEPVMTLSGVNQGDRFGRGLALADVDGDGVTDLVVGVPRADTATLLDNGAVVVHRGLGEGRFESAASATYRGPKAGDLYGTQVAVCDVDADGYPDLIVTAPSAEEGSATTQGGLMVHLGSATGFAASPSFTRWGVAPQAGAWVGTTNLQLGTVLATGDLDDDGACDVVAASPDALSLAGAVWLYRGIPRASGPEGLSLTPVRAWSGEYAGGTASRLGCGVGVGDLDGDGKDDLVVGQRAFSTVAGAANAAGAVRVERGGAWLGAPETAWRTATDFAWSAFGTASSDVFGYSVAIGDASGDGLADVIVGAQADEVAGGAANAGVVHVFPGVANAVPASVASRIIPGTNAGDRLGTFLLSLNMPNVSGFGILAMSQYSDENGPEVGGVHVLSRSAAETRMNLAMPLDLAPWRHGHALAALPDLDGDGFRELAVGTPDQLVLAPTGTEHRAFTGVVTLHRGTDAATSSGFASPAFQTLSGFAGHSASDRFGNDIAALGDFDGDGRGDLAVVARFEDRASSYAVATYQNIDCPATAMTNTGAVYVFSGNGAGGYSPTPTFVLFGDQAESTFDRVIGPGDLDKDGKADLIVASDLLDDTGKTNSGGFYVWLGRSATASKITASCTPNLKWFGRAASDGAGVALAALGDIDRDGCRDAAIGAPLQGTTDAGSVYLLLGAGCASASWRVAALTGPASNDGIGQTLDAADLDGDGLVELIVGSTRHRIGATLYGAVWLVEGTRLASAAALATPIGTAEGTLPLIAEADTARLRLEGRTANERFSLPLALIPTLGLSGIPALAIGSGAGDRTGFALVSSVLIHPLRRDGAAWRIEPTPVAILAGETRYTEVLGTGAFAVARQGDHAALALGLEESNALAPDFGAVYLAPLGPVDSAVQEVGP